MTQTRREFCIHACQSLSLAAIVSSIAGCGGGPADPSSNVPLLSNIGGSVANGAVTVNVDPNAALGSVGGAALVSASSSNFLVTRTAQDSFTALTAVCTHEGCTVTGLSNQRFTCPCHGSQYSSSGAVLRGPATQSLRQFATSFANNVLTITL